MSKNISVASAFESVLIEKHLKIKTIFDKRFKTIFQNLNNINNIEHFNDSDEFRLVTKNGRELDIDDSYRRYPGYNKFNNIYKSFFDNKYRHSDIKHFHTEFEIREFWKPENKPITHLCITLTEKYIQDKLDSFIQQYYDKYKPLHIFKAQDVFVTCYILVSETHTLYIKFARADISYSSEDDYYTNFSTTLNIYYSNIFIANISDFDIRTDMKWQHIFDHNMYNLNIKAIKSWEFEPEITNRIFKLQQQNRTYSTRDISRLIYPNSSPKTSPQISPTELSKEFSHMTVNKLKDIAKDLGLKGISGLRKAKLVKVVTAAKTRSSPK